MITKGQLYVAKEDLEIICMTSWSAPFTGGSDRILPKGEKFRILNDPRAGATAVYCEPVRYKELHKHMVLFSDRLKFWIYRGYYLCINIKEIHNKCALV